NVLAVADTVKSRGDRADLGRKLDRRVHRVLTIGAVSGLVVKIQRRDRRAKSVHRVRILREALHEGNYLGRNRIIRLKTRLQVSKLVCFWRPSVPQKINDLFERRMLSEVMNVVALVN